MSICFDSELRFGNLSVTFATLFQNYVILYGSGNYNLFGMKNVIKFISKFNLIVYIYKANVTCSRHFLNSPSYRYVLNKYNINIL